MQGSCWTCRSRTIQCDQSQSPCLKCEKAGLECFEKRPLKWVKGVAVRGRLRGHVYGEDSENSERAPLERRKGNQALSARHLAADTSLSPGLQDPRVHNLDRSSKFYIDYYSKRICKLYILYDSDSNPFRNLLSYTLENSALQKSIIALAARHFANTGHSFNQIDAIVSTRFDKAHLDALLFKKQAIEALSRSLSHVDKSEKDATMATILLLIFLDLLESGIDGWNFHLRGVKGLFNLYWSLIEPGYSGNTNNDPGDTIQETRRFIASQFSLIETLGAALSCTQSVPDYSFDNGETKQQESIVRSFLGCPEFLLKAIQFFSNQRDGIAGLKTPDDSFFHEHIRNTITMLELTESFDSFEWASNFQQPRASSIIDVEKVSILSQAYKMATLLYGRRVLRALQTTIPDNEELVSQLLSLIHDLRCDVTLFKCLLWPTFIAGLDCREKQQQTLVIETLEMLWNLTSCLNVISASKILREHWERTNLPETPMQGKSDIEGLAGGWLLI